MKNNLKKVILAIAIGFLLSGIAVGAAEVLYSKNFTYSTSNSTLTSTNVQGAIDELATKWNNVKDSYCPSKYKCYKLKNSPEPGDYVKMTPTLTSYTTDTSKTGYTSTQTINPSELNLWRVLKVNSDGTIEMISEYTSSTLVYFRGQTGYKNLVGYLNVLASKYENSKYTIGSRYVGYNGQTEYLTDTANTVDSTSTTAPWTSSTGSNTVESQGGGDTLYQNDYNLIKSALGTVVANKVGTSSTSSYWLASRSYSYNSSTYWDYSGRYVNTYGSLNNGTLYSYISGSFSTNNRSSALRPIVILKSGISYTPALGTSENPFVLN